MQSETFPISVEKIISTLERAFKKQKQLQVVEVLREAQAKLEYDGYDGYGGGSHHFHLVLNIDVELHSDIELKIENIERIIKDKIDSLRLFVGNRFITEVIIKVALDENGLNENSDVPSVSVERIWKEKSFRLFLSHNSTYKRSASELKDALELFGVSVFVAHEDIKPSEVWQTEIENALSAMHVLIALLTDDFHDSKWTDQEVGYALGKGVLVIPVMSPTVPYGLLGKLQALKIRDKQAKLLAADIIDILLSQKKMRDLVCEALVSFFENSTSYIQSIEISKKLETIDFCTDEQIKRILVALKKNKQVSKASGVEERLKHLKTKVLQIDQNSNDLPF